MRGKSLILPTNAFPACGLYRITVEDRQQFSIARQV